MELFECERLQARISPATCETNRKRTGHYQIFACQGCPGLGQKIDDKEVSDMAQRCSVAGCDKTVQHKCAGMCKSHYREYLEAMAAERDAVTSETLAQTDARPQSFGKVTNAEGASVSFGVDGLVLQAVREARAEAEARLLPQLSGLKPSVALVRAARIVEQLDRIGR
jgi:hypothetical protein